LTVGVSVVGRSGRFATNFCHSAGCAWKYLSRGAESRGATTFARFGAFSGWASATPNAAIDAMPSPSIGRKIHEFVIAFPPTKKSPQIGLIPDHYNQSSWPRKPSARAQKPRLWVSVPYP
jgi:hypothetical protein